MKKGTKITLGLLAVIVISATIYIVDFTDVFHKVKYSADLKSFTNSFELKAGDLVYRRGKSFESFAVIMADRRSEYSHVGMVVENDNEIFIVHSVPGENEGKNEFIIMEDVRSFLNFTKATEYAIYRPKNITQDNINIACNYAIKAVEDKCVFDHDYDLDTYNELYCSELIWKAFKQGGANLIDKGLDKLKVFLTDVQIIMPSTLTKNSYFEKIYVYK